MHWSSLLHQHAHQLYFNDYVSVICQIKSNLLFRLLFFKNSTRPQNREPKIFRIHLFPKKQDPKNETPKSRPETRFAYTLIFFDQAIFFVYKNDINGCPPKITQVLKTQLKHSKKKSAPWLKHSSENRARALFSKLKTQNSKNTNFLDIKFARCKKDFVVALVALVIS